MFEKWFKTNNKKEIKSSVEGVAHVDEGIFEEEKFDDKLDDIQENFKDNKVSKRNFHAGSRRKEEVGENWSVGVEKYLTKHENSRKPEYKDLHSDWKEKSVFDEPLSKQEMSDEHLDSLMQQEEDKKSMQEFYADEDDFEEDDYQNAA